MVSVPGSVIVHAFQAGLALQNMQPSGPAGVDHALGEIGEIVRQVRDLAFPVDLVHAFIPVLGYADDAIIVAAGPCAGRAWRRSAASGQAPTSAADCASRDLPTRTQVTHNSPRANGGAKSSRGRCSCSLPPVRAADIHPASATVKQRSGGILPRWLARE